jgi:hypothetical protein
MPESTSPDVELEVQIAKASTELSAAAKREDEAHALTIYGRTTERADHLEALEAYLVARRKLRSLEAARHA